jgi:hypothetical protein
MFPSGRGRGSPNSSAGCRRTTCGAGSVRRLPVTAGPRQRTGFLRRPRQPSLGGRASPAEPRQSRVGAVALRGNPRNLLKRCRRRYATPAALRTPAAPSWLLWPLPRTALRGLSADLGDGRPSKRSKSAITQTTRWPSCAPSWPMSWFFSASTPTRGTT